MIDEVMPNIYRLEIPLPKNPLRVVNSYVIKGEGRFLIIDTGQNREECIDAMRSGLAELRVDLERTDFFITHLHADHLGLVANLATAKSKVYLGEVDIEINLYETSRTLEYWQRWDNLYLAHGFPKDELARAAKTHPARRFGLLEKVAFSVVKEGDLIEIGDYTFRCIETPGHSPGHVCLYEADNKVLVSGDHILNDITPNITVWLDMENSLRRYLESLDKVYGLDVSIVLPGHRRPFTNHRVRIRELRYHHQARLAEAMAALQHGPQTAYQVAPHVSWDISFESWDLFPPMQKWFAMGETIAHLKYLNATGRAQEIEKGEHILYALS
jgi:glyoxylase-like metal-dependent hydrolase (beta-lactamase superfamily II)